jgi:hypothetical protein
MKYTLSLLALGTLGACTALNGGHIVNFADENTFVVQYDTLLTSSARTSRLAEDHCAKFDRKAVAVDAKMPGIKLGIVEETYDCI